jgi:hypothetical protein
MTDPILRLADAADDFRAAARRLHDHAADPACAQLVPAALDAIEDALSTLSRTCYAAGRSLVPLGDSGDGIAERFARAAASWPSPRGGAAPSYEQQACVLSSMHDAGAALRVAADHCARAAGNAAETMEPVEALAASRVVMPLARRRPAS